ncbi:DUF1003 domain-containing protein [Methylobacterium sp. BTF04]|uniref:DUF1003 domain-containing protein n=1 Tax=Methylobacterium sp. BTF04 TaxID=2708300 RepID=UPI0013D24956|nr:DUF1003 domain-containing protein [Methylobacterium sp. BTF04]NEU11750.1 DUF1003 domain-containing protein [Methylobacterium sp. BTF04]
MDDAVTRLGRQLLDDGLAQFSEREQRVIALIARRRPIARSADEAAAETETVGDRIADKVAQFGGSWAFMIGFIAILIGWIVVNTVILARYGREFDAYPYIFLNLMLSMVAALQAPVILMSQNRQAARDRVAASLDYEVNLKAEIEIMALHEKLDEIRIHHLEGVLHEQGELLRTLVRQTERAGTTQPVPATATR